MRPPEGRVHVSPPSRLTRTPSTSTPAQTKWWSNGFDHKRGNARLRYVHAIRGKFRWQFFPVKTAVTRAKERRQSSAGEHCIGVYRIDGDAPDVIRIQRRFNVLEGRAAVFASIEAIVCARVDDPGIPWMHRETKDRSPTLVSLP